MGAKDYDFADDVPSYRDEKNMSYRSKSSERTRKKRKAPRSQGKAPGGIHQRRNKRTNW